MFKRGARSLSFSARGRRRARDRRGFTIIEVALASFIMAFGIAASIITLQVGFRAIDVARDSTLASQIMQSEIERLRLMPWSNIATTAIDSIVELPLIEPVSLASMFSSNPALTAKFTVTRLVTPDLARSTDIRYITIRVVWKSSDGMNHNRTFTTMYSKNGLYDFYYTVAHS